jgi:Flp pilus assembly protein TadG
MACKAAARFKLPIERDDGSTIVETTIALTVFFLMLFAIVEFGRALYAYHFVSNAAREATRFAAVHGKTCNTDADGGSCTPTGGPASPGNPTPINDFVSTITPPGIDPTKVTTTPAWPVEADSPTICGAAVTGIGGPYPNYPGCTVQVQVSYVFDFLVPLVHTGSVTLSSTSEMVIAH